MIYRQTKLDNTRKLKDIYFFDPDDGEFKEIISTYWKILKIPMTTMSTKLKTIQRPNKLLKKTDSEIVETRESTLNSLESILSEDLIVEKGFHFMKSLSFDAQICSHVPSDENTGCEANSGQKNGRKKFKKLTKWQLLRRPKRKRNSDKNFW